MRTSIARVVFASLVVSLVACGAPTRGDDDGTTDGNNANGDGNNQDNCSAEAKLVFVVDENNTLSTFDPQTGMFMDKGTLNCPASGLGASPFSMGIDRNAGAWVLYSSGELFHVDTDTLACMKTTWSPGANGLFEYGMGFSTDTPGGTTDTLFIAGGANPSDPTAALNKLDLNSMTATPIGTVNDSPELTGTGDAELWGFFPSATSPRIDKLDKTSGGVLQSLPLTSLAGSPTAWAFAFFGGDFYVFLMRDLETSTTVYHVNGMTGAVMGSMPTSGRVIVGAGVSTCAPTVIL